ncbi:MAG: hypothetical protein NXI10_11705 [bacterium]|nr:hypothetical protein [bacterium]
MNLRTFLPALGLLLATTSYGQLSNELGTTSKLRVDPAPVSHLERYGVDYMVKNYDFNGDSTILENINLAYLEQFREADSDVEVIDSNTGLTVILFYRKRSNTLNNISESE